MWLDNHGIPHDGEPPSGHQKFGGRWYPVNQTETRPRLDLRRELVRSSTW